MPVEGGGGFCVNVAVQDLFAFMLVVPVELELLGPSSPPLRPASRFMLMVHVALEPQEEQAPPQPVKLEPASAVAVRVTEVLAV